MSYCKTDLALETYNCGMSSSFHDGDESIRSNKQFGALLFCELLIVCLSVIVVGFVGLFVVVSWVTLGWVVLGYYI